MSEKAGRKGKLWSGRFDEPVTDLVKRFTASVAFDQRLAEFDIEGSIAHARMLHAVGIIAAADFAAIERGLRRSARRSRAARFNGRSISKTCISTSSGA